MSEARLKNALYTATAVATGGRNGRTKNGDGVVNLELGTPKVMGGAGKPGTTTPEDLFAAGYAACFGSACELAAKTILKLTPTSLEVQATVILGADEAGGYALEVKLQVTVGGLSADDAQKVVKTGHEVCPYSKATRGNVRVTVEARAV